MSEKSRTTRALTILERVASAERPLRIADLVEGCELPKATVHRICTLLRSQGYLRTDMDGKGLVPGPRLRTLSDAVMANQSQFAFRHAVLESVARQIGETCNISVPDGLSMIYWDRVETEWPLKVQLPVGTRVPLYCTASGKLFLASLAPARRRQLIARLERTSDRDTQVRIVWRDPIDQGRQVRPFGERPVTVDEVGKGVDISIPDLVRLS